MDINDERYWSTSFFGVTSIQLQHDTLDSGVRILRVRVLDEDNDCTGDIVFFGGRDEPIALRFKEDS